MLAEVEIADKTVALVGPWGEGEFAAVREALDASSLQLSAVDVRNAIEIVLSLPSPPEVLAIAQSRPGTIDEAALRRLAAQAPLTRVVIVAGSWCEGEVRTGKPPAGVIRLYWYEFAAWLRANIAVVRRGDCPSWSAPLAEPRAGTWIAENATAYSQSRGHTVVSTIDYHAFTAVEAVLARRGYSCEWEPRHRANRKICGNADDRPTAGVFDGGQLDADELAHLADFAHRFGANGTPVIVLLDFPRAEHLEAAYRAGATIVMGKPYQATLLCEAISTS